MRFNFIAAALVVSHCSAQQPNCDDDEVVLLQQTHRVEALPKTAMTEDSKWPSHHHSPTAQHPPHGPDSEGLCLWSSVFGRIVPTTVNEVQDLVKHHCETWYPATLCSPLIDELFSVFAEGSTEFHSGLEEHPLFCSSLSDLIHASSDHKEDMADAVALAEIDKARTSTHLAVRKQRRDTPLRGPDGGGLCQWSSVFGDVVPTTLQEVRAMIASRCETLYAEALCSPIVDAGFHVFAEGTTEFHSELQGHPLFCSALTELIHASFDHQHDSSDHASALLSARATTGSGHSTLEQSLSSK